MKKWKPCSSKITFAPVGALLQIDVHKTAALLGMWPLPLTYPSFGDVIAAVFKYTAVTSKNQKIFSGNL